MEPGPEAEPEPEPAVEPQEEAGVEPEPQAEPEKEMEEDEPEPEPEPEPARAGGEPEPEPEPADGGFELLDPAEAEGAEDLPTVLRAQEAEAARLASEFGGLQIERDGAGDEDSDDDDEDSGDEEEFVDVRELEAEGPDAEALALCEQLVASPEALALSEEERVHVAADCRSACQRAFTSADREIAQLTMVRIATAIGLSDSEVAFFSDISLDPAVRQAWQEVSEAAAPILAPARRLGVIVVLVGTLTNNGRYDARCRTFLRRLAQAYDVDWAKVRVTESMHLEHMVVRKSEEANAAAANAAAEQSSNKWGRRLKVGGAAVLGGAAMVLTAGVAAPAVVGVFGLVGLGGVLSAVGGAGFVSVLFGAAGAGLGGYKVARRTGDVEEFGFEPIGDPQAKAAAGQTTEDEQFVLASQTGLTRKLTVTIFASREEADAAWAARDMMDAHLLSSVQAGRSVDLEKYVTLDSTLEALRAETERGVNWEREKRLREPDGWLDPTGQPRFDDGPRLVGCRIFVEGHGEGTVAAFDKAMFGVSEHVINYDSVIGHTGTAVKLRRKGNTDEARWLVQCNKSGEPVRASEQVAEQPESASAGAEGGPSVGMCVTIGVSGWLSNKEDSVSAHWQFLRQLMSGSEAHALCWESEMLVDLGVCFEQLAKNFLKNQVGKAVAVRVGLGATVAALMLPATLVAAASVIDNPWSMAISRADKAGALLASLLLERQQGHRPVILLGWSAGARMIFRCLELLAEAGEEGRGIVDSAFLLGSPLEADAERWAKAKGAVADRLVNGYAPGDWLLSLCHRTITVTAAPLAGLSPVPHPCVAPPALLLAARLTASRICAEPWRMCTLAPSWARKATSSTARARSGSSRRSELRSLASAPRKSWWPRSRTRKRRPSHAPSPRRRFRPCNSNAGGNELLYRRRLEKTRRDSSRCIVAMHG